MKKIFIILGILIFSTATVAKQSFEAGFGTNYGALGGVVVTQDLSSNVEMFAGLGVGMESVAYVVGTKFWLNNTTRLTMNYGTNCIDETYDISTGKYAWKDYEGLNFGIGYAFSGKDEAGWAFDLMLLDTSDCNADSTALDIDYDSAIRMSAGYRF